MPSHISEEFRVTPRVTEAEPRHDETGCRDDARPNLAVRRLDACDRRHAPIRSRDRMTEDHDDTTLPPKTLRRLAAHPERHADAG